MRDGKYDIIVSDSIGGLVEKVNEACKDGWSPQYQPFEYGGNICQVMNSKKLGIGAYPEPPTPPSKRVVKDGDIPPDYQI